MIKLKRSQLLLTVHMYNLFTKKIHLQGLAVKAQQMAAAALLGGSIQNSESILLHNGFTYHAILNNIKLHNWNR